MCLTPEDKKPSCIWHNYTEPLILILEMPSERCSTESSTDLKVKRVGLESAPSFPEKYEALCALELFILLFRPTYFSGFSLLLHNILHCPRFIWRGSWTQEDLMACLSVKHCITAYIKHHLKVTIFGYLKWYN